MPTHRPTPTPHAFGGLLVLVALTALGACGNQAEPDADAPITRDQFIDAVVALRNAEIDLTAEIDDDSVLAARYEVARDSILQAQGVTEAQLRAFLAYHEDLGVQEVIWDTIAERLKRPRQWEQDQQEKVQERELMFPRDGPSRRPGGDPDDESPGPGDPR